MKTLALAAVLLSTSCSVRAWRIASAASAATAATAATCALECGSGPARDVSDVLLVIEAAALAAIVPLAGSFTFFAEGGHK